MINKDFLSKMKKDATLINTSRGTLTNEAELIEFLNANPGFTYATDVYQNEPVEKKCAFASELAKHPQVIGTHHIGASTVQAEANKYKKKY
jgi:D-3-phosphoglycerate dehydrogenase